MTSGFSVEQGQGARLQLYGYNGGQYLPTLLTSTHLLLAGNDSVDLSVAC